MNSKKNDQGVTNTVSEMLLNLYPRTLFNEYNEEDDDDYAQGLYGVASRTYMRGLILGTCDKFKRPVVILQKKIRQDSEICKKCMGSTNTSFCYARNYSRLESTLFYEHWAILCKEIRNAKQKDNCCKQDEIIADFLLTKKNELRPGKLKINCNDYDIDAEIYKEDCGNHICIRYECPFSHQDELAINVDVEGIEGVIIIGQLLFEETSNKQLKNFVKAVNDYCTDKEKVGLIESADSNNRTKKICDTVKDAFESVTELEASLKKEYKFKVEDNVRILQEKMIETFDESYKKVIPILNKARMDEVEKCNTKYNFLKYALKDALKVFSKAMGEENLTCVNYLLSDGLHFKSEYTLDKVFDSNQLNENITELITSYTGTFACDGFTDFKNGYYVYRRNLDLLEEKYAYIIVKELKHDKAIDRLFNGFMQYISLAITKLYAQYNGAQIKSYTKVMRHELGQLNEAVLIRINTFQEAVNKQVEHNYNHDFIQESNHAITDFKSHAHSTMLRCNSSRYFTRLPQLQLSLFYPYDSFLYKWKYIYLKAAQNKQIDFVMAPVQFADLLRPQMYADKSMIEQVAYNLTNNALKYSIPGSTITIDCKLNDQKNLYQLIVTNYGRAISDEEKKKIFEYGYRGSNQKEANGSGIGLYLSQKIAEEHGGTLNLITEKVSDYDVSCLYLYGDMPNKFIDAELKEKVTQEIQRLKGTNYTYEIRKPQIKNSSMTPYVIKKYLKSGTIKYTFILSIPHNKKGWF